MENKQNNRNGMELIEPDNMGILEDADGSADVIGLCGDSMKLYLRIKDSKILDAKFYTDGCNASRFCGSTAARLAKGKSIKEVLRISPADIIDSWKEIPYGNVHCSILAVNTLHKAVADYLLRTNGV